MFSSMIIGDVDEGWFTTTTFYIEIHIYFLDLFSKSLLSLLYNHLGKILHCDTEMFLEV